MRLPAPWYVDPGTGLMGPVGLDLPQRVVTRLLNAPSIPPEAAAEVRAQLSRRMPAAKLPVPAELQPPEPVRANDAAASAADQRHAAQRSKLRARIRAGCSGRGLYAVPLARLSYEYGPVTLPRSLKPLPRIIVHDGTLYEVERDRAAEAAALAELTGLGLRLGARGGAGLLPARPHR